MNEGMVIAEFDKNTREKLRVSLTEYNGVDLLDIRAFYSAGGEMKPGKGLAIRRELITPLRKALQAAEKAQAADKATKDSAVPKAEAGSLSPGPEN